MRLAVSALGVAAVILGMMLVAYGPVDRINPVTSESTITISEAPTQTVWGSALKILQREEIQLVVEKYGRQAVPFDVVMPETAEPASYRIFVKLSVSGGDVWAVGLDEANYWLWRDISHPSDVHYASAIFKGAIGELTIQATKPGRYYLVFDNMLASEPREPKSVTITSYDGWNEVSEKITQSFSISVITKHYVEVRRDPTTVWGGYGLLGLGVIMMIAGLITGGAKTKSPF